MNKKQKRKEKKYMLQLHIVRWWHSSNRCIFPCHCSFELTKNRCPKIVMMLAAKQKYTTTDWLTVLFTSTQLSSLQCKVKKSCFIAKYATLFMERYKREQKYAL